MSVVVKVNVCADCLLTLDLEREGAGPAWNAHGKSERFQLWRDYDLTPGECSYVDFLDVTMCGVCRGSLTRDRRRSDDGNFPYERRVSMIADRRSPFNRGSRFLLASLRVA